MDVVIELVSWAGGLLSDHTLMGVVVGALSSIGTTVLVNRGNSAIQRENRRYGARLELIKDELEELVQLQEALQSWGRSYVQDRLSLMRDGLYADNGNRLSKDEYSERLRADHATVSLLASRVGCEELRKQITEAMRKSIALTNNVEEINRIMDTTIVLLSECIERVGQEIRLKREELSNLL